MVRERQERSFGTWLSTRPAVVVWLAALGVVFGSRPVAAQLEEPDSRFADYLIHELKYVDTARRFLESIRKDYSDSRARCDIEYLLNDLLKLEGKDEEYLSGLDVLRKRCSSHSRASLSSLPKILNAMDKVMKAFDRAKAKPAAEAVEMRAAARKAFEETVSKPLDASIDELVGQVTKIEENYRKRLRTKPDTPEPEELSNLLQSRNQMMLARVQIYLFYARLLPVTDKELADEREQILDKGLKLAERFVEDRTEFYFMQYQAQLYKGLYEKELGQFQAAVDSLSILISLKPNRLTPELAKVFRKLHIESLLHAAQAANEAGLYQQAASMVQRRMLTPRNDALDLSKANRDPALEKYYVLAKLEWAIGLAGAGQPDRGLAVVQEVIEEYSSLPSPVARAYVTDARKALGSIAEVASVALGAIGYYQGGMGLYSQGKYDEALGLFLQGLGAVNARDRDEVAPQCLNKIGEISYLLTRFPEATIAYIELGTNFPKSPLAPKAATNAVAAATKLPSGHTGFRRLEDQANRLYDDLGGSGLVVFQAHMVEAAELEQQGKFREAIELYKKVEKKTPEGEKVPFYYRAKVKLYDCYFQEWAGKGAVVRGRDTTIDKVAEQLKKAIGLAGKTGEKDAAMLGTFILGQIDYLRENWDGVVSTYQAFVTTYAGDKDYRPASLYYSIEASVKKGDGDGGERTYQVLKKDFPKERTTQYAVQLLIDYYSSHDQPEKAAELLNNDYLTHPDAQADLKDPERVMNVVDILLLGGQVAAAKKWLARLEKMIDPSNEAVYKRYLYRVAALSFGEKKYELTIQKLGEYIKRYNPPPHEEDTPYIYKMMGESFFELNKKTNGAGSNRIDGLTKAADFFGLAINVIGERREVDPKAEGFYWQWYLRWLTIKKFLCDAGDDNACLDVIRFVSAKERTVPEEYKARFFNLRDEAKKKAPARGSKK